MTEFEKSSPPISVIKILQLIKSVTEITTFLQFLPWAAVHGDQIKQENRFSTLPMAIHISLRWSFWSKGVALYPGLRCMEFNGNYFDWKSTLPRATDISLPRGGLLVEVGLSWKLILQKDSLMEH